MCTNNCGYDDASEDTDMEMYSDATYELLTEASYDYDYDYDDDEYDEYDDYDDWTSYDDDDDCKDCHNCGHVWTAEVTCHYCGSALSD